MPLYGRPVGEIRKRFWRYCDMTLDRPKILHILTFFLGIHLKTDFRDKNTDFRVFISVRFGAVFKNPDGVIVCPPAEVRMARIN